MEWIENGCIEMDEKLSLPYSEGIGRISGSKKEFLLDFKIPHQLLKEREKTWGNLFMKFSKQNLNEVEFDLSTLQPVQDIEEKYHTKVRSSLRKSHNFIQYWVDTGNLPFSINSELSETGSSLREEEFSTGLHASENKKYLEKSNQCRGTSLSYSSVDTAAYILSNLNITKKQRTLDIIKDSKQDAKKNVNTNNNHNQIYNNNTLNIVRKDAKFKQVSNCIKDNNRKVPEEKMAKQQEKQPSAVSILDETIINQDNHNNQVRGYNFSPIKETSINSEMNTDCKNYFYSSLEDIRSIDENEKPIQRKKLYNDRDSPVDLIDIKISNKSKNEKKNKTLHPALYVSPHCLQKKKRKKRSSLLNKAIAKYSQNGKFVFNNGNNTEIMDEENREIASITENIVEKAPTPKLTKRLKECSRRKQHCNDITNAKDAAKDISKLMTNLDEVRLDKYLETNQNELSDRNMNPVVRLKRLSNNCLQYYLTKRPSTKDSILIENDIEVEHKNENVLNDIDAKDIEKDSAIFSINMDHNKSQNICSSTDSNTNSKCIDKCDDISLSNLHKKKFDKDERIAQTFSGIKVLQNEKESNDKVPEISLKNKPQIVPLKEKSVKKTSDCRCTLNTNETSYCKQCNYKKIYNMNPCVVLEKNSFDHFYKTYLTLQENNNIESHSQLRKQYKNQSVTQSQNFITESEDTSSNESKSTNKSNTKDTPKVRHRLTLIESSDEEDGFLTSVQKLRSKKANYGNINHLNQVKNYSSSEKDKCLVSKTRFINTRSRKRKPIDDLNKNNIINDSDDFDDSDGIIYNDYNKSTYNIEKHKALNDINKDNIIYDSDASNEIVYDKYDKGTHNIERHKTLENYNESNIIHDSNDSDQTMYNNYNKSRYYRRSKERHMNNSLTKLKPILKLHIEKVQSDSKRSMVSLKKSPCIVLSKISESELLGRNKRKSSLQRLLSVSNSDFSDAETRSILLNTARNNSKEIDSMEHAGKYNLRNTRSNFGQNKYEIDSDSDSSAHTARNNSKEIDSMEHAGKYNLRNTRSNFGQNKYEIVSDSDSSAHTACNNSKEIHSMEHAGKYNLRNTRSNFGQNKYEIVSDSDSSAHTARNNSKEIHSMEHAGKYNLRNTRSNFGQKKYEIASDSDSSMHTLYLTGYNHSLIKYSKKNNMIDETPMQRYVKDKANKKYIDNKKQNNGYIKKNLSLTLRTKLNYVSDLESD